MPKDKKVADDSKLRDESEEPSEKSEESNQVSEGKKRKRNDTADSSNGEPAYDAKEDTEANDHAIAQELQNEADLMFQEMKNSKKHSSSSAISTPTKIASGQSAASPAVVGNIGLLLHGEGKLAIGLVASNVGIIQSYLRGTTEDPITGQFTSIAGVPVTAERLTSFCKQHDLNLDVAMTLLHRASALRHTISGDTHVITHFMTEATDTPQELIVTSTELYKLLEHIKVAMDGREEDARFVKANKIPKQLAIEILDPVKTTPEQRLILNAITDLF